MGANRINFKTYINNGTFYIPLYQRDFVWKKEQATRFLNEIIELHEASFDDETDRKIFCGSAYLKSNNENYWDIIDGQQRTTFLFGLKWSLMQRINEIKENIDDLESKSTKKTLDKFKDLSTSLESFQIKTAKAKNKDSFENQMISQTGSIIKVFKEIKSILDKYIEDSKKLNNVMIDVIEFILFIFTKVELVEVKVETEDDINDIFKSINSKGKVLGAWDIIRNDLYRKSNDGESLLQNIDDNLDELDSDYNIKREEFIQGYLMHKKQEYVPKGRILKEFDELSSKIKPEVIKDDINNFINEIKKFDKDSASNGVNFVKSYFKLTKEFKFTQIRTVSLAALMSWGMKNTIDNSIKRLFINAVIYITIGGGRGNVFEKFFLANSNMKTILSNPEGLNNLINQSEFYADNLKIINQDQEIINEKIDENHSMLKLLIWLETPTSEYHKVIHSLKYEYEHVFPKKFSLWKEKYDYWKDVDDTDAYLEKLGNIILIHKLLNSKISNSIFDEKIKWYLENEVDGEENKHYIFTRNLSLDKDLSYLKGIYDISYDIIWNKELILERTKKITELISQSIKKNI